MSERSVVHATFVVARTLEAPPSRVFAAFADPKIHESWFVKANNWPVAEYRHDFRVGGRESGRFSPDGTTVYLNETVYQDIVPDRRIIMAYTMARGETPISASLGTIELRPEGSGTRLTYTEQGAFLDNQDQASDREAGWMSLLNSLEVELRREPVAA